VPYYEVMASRYESIGARYEISDTTGARDGISGYLGHLLLCR
jgi:hypothetical protein